MTPEERMRSLKARILDCASSASEGHVPSALSILDILWVEYAFVMSEQSEKGLAVDRFILSKGHASLGIYAVLEALGIIPTHWLDTFGSFDSPLGGHPDRLKVPGIEASTGSLGHGLPVGVGLALGNRLAGDNSRVVVLIGDGEANEGTTWESAAIATHHELSKLILICDFNHSGDRALSMGSIEQKFRAFGWTTAIIDGHNHEEIYGALTVERQSEPLAIIANTIKGNGIPSMENNPAWHHAFPSRDQLSQLKEELR